METQSNLGFSEYDYLFKIVLVGASGVGKTSLILRYCESAFKPIYSATLGIDFRIRTVKVRDKVAKLQIWDTAGQERYNALSPVYFRGCHGCIVVYDLTDQSTLADATAYLSKLTSDYGISGDCSLLVGNKSDLEENRVVNRSLALEIARERQAGYIETSAKTAEQVETVFESLTERLMEKCDKGELNVELALQQKKNIIDAKSIEIRKAKSLKSDFTVKGAENRGCCVFF